MAHTASSPRREILGVSTNVITGFLGAGKSTAILHLLRHKPADERWAVLVNEFGEVGVDGSILGGRVVAASVDAALDRASLFYRPSPSA